MATAAKFSLEILPGYAYARARRSESPVALFRDRRAARELAVALVTDPTGAVGRIEVTTLLLAVDRIDDARADLARITRQGAGNGLQERVAIGNRKRAGGGENGVKLDVGQADR